jgi:hypothetical protein
MFENVFFRREKKQGIFVPDEIVNISYWLVLIVKNVFKWMYAVSLLSDKNFALVVILLICPMLKFILIGLGNIYKFRQNFRRPVFVVFIVIIILLESFFEMPIHILFPKNHLYLNTNYYKIYDLMKYRQVEIFTEILENFIIFLFILFFSFFKGKVTTTTIVCFSFCIAMLVYFVIAEFYFSCMYEEVKEDMIRKGTTNKEYRNVPNLQLNMPHIDRLFDNNQKLEHHNEENKSNGSNEKNSVPSNRYLITNEKSTDEMNSNLLKK